jgi:hypothetical protein
MEHHVIIERSNWFDEKKFEYYIYVSMNPHLSWYRRIWPAIKYILGIDKGFIAYGETILTEEDFKSLSTIFN